jgi:predicted ferric reductase
MQNLVSLYSFTVVINALLLQGILIYLVRGGRNAYLNSVMNFRKPKSSLARYYAWRTKRLLNTVIEGIVYEIILIGSIVVILYPRGGVQLILDLLAITAFVVVLSSISSIQMIRRVSEVLKKEVIVLKRIEDSDDRIDLIRQMVEELYQAGAYADGHIWFALFKIAQQQDVVGWSVRDVLMEKSKAIADRIDSHMWLFP